VAQHAVYVSLYQEMVGCAPSVQWWGLHHDNAKAYLPDIPSPIKQTRDMEFYRYAERQLMSLVEHKFDLGPRPVSLAHHDKVMLATEVHHLMRHPPEPWLHIKGVEPDERFPFRLMSPDQAFRLYMDRYHEVAERVGFPLDMGYGC
jgi:hypothetical protein